MAKWADQHTDDRAEHLAWCKQRALEYVDTGDLVGAVTSFASDMDKHPGTAAYLHSPAIATLFATDGINGALEDNPAKVRRFIEGCH